MTMLVYNRPPSLPLSATVMTTMMVTVTVTDATDDHAQMDNWATGWWKVSMVIAFVVVVVIGQW